MWCRASPRSRQRARADGIVIMPGNNLGYFGPEETLLRSLGRDRSRSLAGCQAGRFVLGIESDGAVKGCPSLQSASTSAATCASVPCARSGPTRPELAFARDRTVAELWGFCRTCRVRRDLPRRLQLHGPRRVRPSRQQPVLSLPGAHARKQGLRERLVAATAADGRPFDCGTFELVLEPLDAPDPEAATPRSELVRDPQAGAARR